jgi:hypothetical protein
MRLTIRRSLAALLLLALPFQAMAVASMACHMQPVQSHSVHHQEHHQSDSQHNQHHQNHHLEHSAGQLQDTHPESDNLNCTFCAASCSLAVAPPARVADSGPAAVSSTMILGVMQRFSSVVPDGLFRPPRS